MTEPMTPEAQGTPTRPYLIRALHEWCVDNGFTPYIAVHVDAAVQVPVEYVKNNEIVLNVGFEATSGLKLGNDQIEFRARFGGIARDIVVPIDHVVAIYARENGQGMAFPMPAGEAAPPPAAPAAAEPVRAAGPAPALRLAAAETAAPAAPEPEPEDEPPAGGGARPTLKRVK